MKLVSLIFIACVLIGSPLCRAATNLDPKLSYSCVVTDSTDGNIPPGSATSGPVTVGSLKSGVIALKSVGSANMIDFYGPLVAFNTLAPNSGYQAFASPPTEPREIHGSIVVKEGRNGAVNLAVKVFPTTRAFDAGGAQAFIFADAPLAYTLACQHN